MQYISNTKEEQKEMLAETGASDVLELFNDIPGKLILKEPLKVSKELPEIEVKKKVEALAAKNKVTKSFLGAGYYSHYIPSVINHILLRSEFYTAYTPYQPEMSQGALQSIFEFQTFIAKLTGMDLANASMYDGSSALAEAVFMSHNITKRDKILVSEGVHPEYREAIKTYCYMHKLDYKEIPCKDGVTDSDELTKEANDETASVIIQNPNFFGCVEDLDKAGTIAHDKKALFVVSVVEATSLGLLKEPRGADIVTGEGQSFGIPISFGGPAFGFMAVTKKLMRKIPGRLVGETVDSEGKKGYIMTLQAREQHIRREKATSNICTNQALLALGGSVYLSMLGTGLKDVANLNVQKANYAKEQIGSIDGFEVAFSSPIYNEFVVKCKDSKKTLEKLKEKDIVAGLDLEKWYPDLKNHILMCVTEVHTKEDIDNFVEELKK